MPEDFEESIPLEFQVIALALRKSGSITYFSENLLPEIVGTPSGNTGLHELYIALLDFYNRTRTDPVDGIAFRSWLEHDTELVDAMGGELVLNELLRTFDSLELSTPESVTGVLRHRANKRRQKDSLQELQLLITKKEYKTDDDNKRIAYLTDQIRALEREIDFNPLESIVTGGDIADRCEELWELPDFLPTPFLNLNKALGYTEKSGLVKGGVYALIARSGAGKSTLAKNFMNHWVETGKTVLYINYEEAVAHWERILLTQVTKQNVYLVDELSEQKKSDLTKTFQNKMKEWGNRFLVRHDPETCYFEDLEQWLRDLIGHNAVIPDVIIIDTIQSLFIKGSGGKPRWGEFEIMMVALEKLARDLNCVIIITAQENANRMKDRREVVQQSDAGGSLTIIQKSTVTIFITEKRLADGNDAVDERIMQLQIPKNRITGTTFMKNPPEIKYIDETKTYEEYDGSQDIYLSPPEELEWDNML